LRLLLDVNVLAISSSDEAGYPSFCVRRTIVRREVSS
jgi:hypothetical protein